jgi:septum site-determining protein MinC
MQAARLRGTASGLVVELASAATFEQARQLLQGLLEEKIPFLEGAAVALDCGSLKLSAGEILALVRSCQDAGLRVIGLHSTDAATSELAHELGLSPVAGGRASASPVGQQRAARPVLEVRCGVVQGTIRSGQYVAFPGSVIVFGDVNPGAEIVADGDVVVWGSLRGTVHAGASGRRESVVCALRLAPTQLRIAECIARAPDEPEVDHGPEMATVKDGKIVVHGWLGSWGTSVEHALEDSRWKWVRKAAFGLRKIGRSAR